MFDADPSQPPAGDSLATAERQRSDLGQPQAARAGIPRLLGKLALIGAAFALLDLWVFRDIVAGRAVFPWDFGLTYHAIPFYWQALASIGHFPEWMPYQTIGYPLQLSLQTGLYYPPLWLFVLLRILYTPHAAAIFQCLHVLAGALGMVWLARARGLSWAVAVLAGVAWQFFGGFFCNAEHVDIVRGYALLPLLLAGLTLARDRTWRRPAARLWSVPFCAMGVATGVYPGQVPPIFAIAGLYLLVQVFDGERVGWRDMAKQASLCLGMLLLGVLMAAPNLGPAVLLKSEIDRSVAPIETAGLRLDHLFTTVFSYETPILPGDISMNSLFVTIPVLAGLFFVPWAALRRHRALVAVLLAAALMIPAGVVFQLAVRLFPSLGYSRFPIADYRALLAVPAVLLGLLGWEHLLAATSRLSWTLAVRAAALLAFVAVGAHRFGWRTLPSTQLRDIAWIFVAVAVLIVAARVRKLPRSVLLVGLGVVMVLDGTRMHGLVTQTWQSTPSRKNFAKANRELEENLRARLPARPERVQKGWLFTHRYPPKLDGYLRGRWVADDYAVSEHLRATMSARGVPAVAQYLYGASHPKVIAPAPGLSPAQVAASPDAPAEGTVIPTRFAADEVVYDVWSTGERILVENEPSFVGWRGFAHCQAASSRVEVSPVPELWPLRAWKIPAGQYRFCATYRLPGLRACLAIASFALLAWLGTALLFWWRGRNRPPRAPRPELPGLCAP